jgi:tetratricopeptide (TPR) repeat protein
MLESFLRKNWAPADRRAWLFSLSIFVPCLLLFLVAFQHGFEWTIRTGLEYTPKEIQIQAWDIPSDLVEFSLGLPNYVFAEYITIDQVLPPGWIYPLALLVFLAAFSFLMAGISYFEGTWLYGSLAAAAAGVTLFEPALFTPLGITANWLSGVVVLLALFPVFAISQWLENWNLSRRWWVLFFFFGLGVFLLTGGDFSIASCSRLTAGLYLPLILAAFLFILLTSGDMLHGLVMLLTRVPGNTQSLLHFCVFSIAWLSTFILTYLKNTGQFQLDIFYPNPFVLQLIVMLTGFWLLPHKDNLGNGSEGFLKGFATAYAGLAMMFLLAALIAFGTANDLMVEVLEDTITLLNFCMGFCFFLYTIINFGDLLSLGLRVHEVLFRPRYMPLSAVGVFGLAGVMLFLFNSDYFPYYQTMAGRYVCLGDQARLEGKALMATEFYKQALNMESRNQRANISLAMLYLETGQTDKALASAQASLEKNPVPEAVLVMAGIHRQRNKPLEEILCLQQGLQNFPNDGRLMNNAGIAFSSTIFPDSARYYLNRAVACKDVSSIARTNLGFLDLWKGKARHGATSKMQEVSDDWAAMNNQMVFASKNREAAPGLAEIMRLFDQFPEEIQPFQLYHAVLNKAIQKDSSGFAELMALENDSIRKYYSEALNMAKALLLYRCGNVYNGVNELLHLYDAGTGNRRDIGLLLGQLYYEQGAYRMAAEYFRQAASGGMKNAWYWYAVSMLDAGKGTEAAAAFREALPYLGTGERILVTVLTDGLSSGNFSNAAKRSDTEKSAFLKVKWNSLKDREIKDLIYLVSGKEVKRLLWKYSFDRAYRESNRERCRLLFQFASNFYRLDKNWKSTLLECRPAFLEICGKDPDAGKEGSAAFFRAMQAEKAGQKSEALALYDKALTEHPFLIRQAVLAVEKIGQLGSRDLAYQKALDLSNLYPASPEYLRLYAMASLRLGLADFAFQCLPKYENLTSSDAAARLRSEMTAELIRKNLPVPSLQNLNP